MVSWTGLWGLGVKGIWVEGLASGSGSKDSWFTGGFDCSGPRGPNLPRHKVQSESEKPMDKNKNLNKLEIGIRNSKSKSIAENRKNAKRKNAKTQNIKLKKTGAECFHKNEKMKKWNQLQMLQTFFMLRPPAIA
jgi:hypothetical protein